MNKIIVPIHCKVCGTEMGGGLTSYLVMGRIAVCSKCGQPVCFFCTSNKLSRLFFRKPPVCRKCFEKDKENCSLAN